MYRETVTRERYKELSKNYISLLELGGQDDWFL